MLVDGSTEACFVIPNELVVKGVVLICTLLVCPRGTCVLASCFVEPSPAIELGRNPLAAVTVSDPFSISIEFVFTEDAKQVKYSNVPVVGSVA